ncbi:MAG: glycoside hydrolase family 9 protein [Mediterranea sp.]|jgi:hypothetical protein|nr:glycoside hydrolase family 9 protein [Mediterranea sp.]
MSKSFKLTATFGCLAVGLLLLTACGGNGSATFVRTNDLVLNDSNYFETRALNYFVFNNKYDALFDDSKVSAVEIIHHGLRTATNGDVRLNPTPGQWDKLPKFVERTVDKAAKRIDVKLEYPDYGFAYTLSGRAADGGFYLSVTTEKPLPDALVGVAGLNMEFFPPVFFEHAYMMDGVPGLFPTSAADNMTIINNIVEPTPLATGTQVEIAPDDPMKHLSIRTTDGADLMLFDGRDKQQNGTFVVRTLLPSVKTGKIAEWFIQAEINPEWIRTPVVSYSQVGYHPSQEKMAVVELDKNDKPLSTITLYKVNPDGSLFDALSGTPTLWGSYTRYNYLQFDFSQVKEPGIYKLKYGDLLTGPFPIDASVYQRAWYPTLDVFMPVQMDHMFVREAYRVWHGAAHLDDAKQAPVNRTDHWDGWRQGATTGNKYKPGQHIPGLNVGGWFDAGDFDIQTPSQQSTVQSLVDVWEEFAPARDETTVDQKNRYTEIHLPDGRPDVLQQIEHGILQLMAQVKAIGYAIPGINESHLYQYRHLGDAVTKTDGIVGNEDDRWAFTDRTPSLNYATATSLAGAARVLAEYDSALSQEALRIAESIWADEHSRSAQEEGQTFFTRSRNPLLTECRTAFELWRTTGKAVYKTRMDEIVPQLQEQLNWNLPFALRLLPYMDDAFKGKVKAAAEQHIQRQLELEKTNPYGISISLSSWAGNGQILSTGVTNYQLHKIFPELVDPELVFRGLNYIYGCHPYHNLSFVSGVGAQPKKVAYGNNRADHSFIPGGIVPGVRLLNPDFPENRDDYQFHWTENEYVIPLAPNYIYLVNAVERLLQQ